MYINVRDYSGRAALPQLVYAIRIASNYKRTIEMKNKKTPLEQQP